MQHVDSPLTPRTGPTLCSLIHLLEEAADRLQHHGLSPLQRIHILRGLYYGTSHSLDFERRNSRLRNWGFNIYLQASSPPDPTPMLGACLVRSLKDTTVVWHGDRRVDAGHILVGLEARTRLGATRLPLWGQGGTGLELGTWLGDLGGAAGLLVLQRLEDPAARAVPLLFSTRTYDLRPNLEGDVAGYLVARNPIVTGRVSMVRAERFVSVAQSLEDYTKEPESDWADRWEIFTRLLGGELGPAGRLLRRQELLAWVRRKTRRFMIWYLLYRLRDAGRLSQAALIEASRHVEGAAVELAELFLTVIEQGLNPGSSQALPDLPASPPGSPWDLLALGRMRGA
ncbi:MAG: hypothetical protein H6P99_764 [Holophagaceae bacterium]|nr:hypothetical protein [Holophagaceae bacterium]